MTAEFISILISILIAAVSLSVQISRTQQATMQAIGDLRERMARLEGLFEGFTGRSTPGA